MCTGSYYVCRSARRHALGAGMQYTPCDPCLRCHRGVNTSLFTPTRLWQHQCRALCLAALTKARKRANARERREGMSGARLTASHHRPNSAVTLHLIHGVSHMPRPTCLVQHLFRTPPSCVHTQRRSEQVLTAEQGRRQGAQGGDVRCALDCIPPPPQQCSHPASHPRSTTGLVQHASSNTCSGRPLRACTRRGGASQVLTAEKGQQQGAQRGDVRCALDCIPASAQQCSNPASHPRCQSHASSNMPRPTPVPDAPFVRAHAEEERAKFLQQRRANARECREGMSGARLTASQHRPNSAVTPHLIHGQPQASSNTCSGTPIRACTCRGGAGRVPAAASCQFQKVHGEEEVRCALDCVPAPPQQCPRIEAAAAVKLKAVRLLHAGAAEGALGLLSV